ncbi:MAG: SulP family inorganic anion transporter [Deltaproteobacteria bacterium]
MIRALDTTHLRADLVAGITVTLVGLPQCLAYALIAGLPPAYGLTTAAVAGMVAALAGAAPNIATGPTNTTGLLVLAAIAPYLGANGLLPAEHLALLASLVLLAAVLRIGLALVGGGALVRFISTSVLTGFTAGAGILIGLMQLDEALGLETVRGTNLWTQVASILNASDEPKVAAIAIATATVVGVAAGKRWFPRFPTPLVLVVAAAIAAPFIRDAGYALPIVADAATMPSGWPPFAMPSLDPQVYGELFLPACAIVMLGTLELTVTLRRTAEPTSMKREILAQGIGNAAGAFLGGIPASASLTRSALLETTGGRTLFAALASATFVLPVIFFGAGVVGMMPQSSLAGILLITAAGMVKRRRVKRIWRTARASRLLFAVTLVGTITLPFVWAILLGVGVALAIQLAISSEPRFTVLDFDGDRLVPHDPATPSAFIVVEISGAIFFAAVDALDEKIESLVPGDAKYVIVDLSHAHQARLGAIQALEDLDRRLAEKGQKLALAGVSPRFHPMLERVDVKIPYTRYAEAPGAAAAACRERLLADVD